MHPIAPALHQQKTEPPPSHSQTGRLAERVVSKQDGEEFIGGLMAVCAACMLVVSLAMLIPGALGVQGGVVMSTGGAIALTVFGALGLTCAICYLMSASSAYCCGEMVSNFMRQN